MHDVGEGHLVKAQVIELADEVDDVVAQLGVVGVEPGAVFVRKVEAGRRAQGVLIRAVGEQLVDKAADLGDKPDTLAVLALFEGGDQRLELGGKLVIQRAAVADGDRGLGVPEKLAVARLHLDHEGVAVDKVCRGVLEALDGDLTGRDIDRADGADVFAGDGLDTRIVGRLENDLGYDGVKAQLPGIGIPSPVPPTAVSVKETRTPLSEMTAYF